MSSIADTLSKNIIINGHNVHIRPINKNDVAKEKSFVERLSPESRHFRFLGGLKSLSDKAAKEFCDIDFDTKMAFIAVTKAADGTEQEIGVSRYTTDQHDQPECAVTVADEWQNHGLGRVLMEHLVDFARSKGKTIIYSIDLADNAHMRQLAKDLGMSRQRDPEDAKMVRYELSL